MKVMISQPMNGRCEEDIKILEEMIENANIENMDMNNCFGGEHIEAIEHILSDYKRLQEEFKAVDSECSRLGHKEVELEKIIELMSEHIFFNQSDKFPIAYSIKDVKDYFINKAKEVK